MNIGDYDTLGEWVESLPSETVEELFNSDDVEKSEQARTDDKWMEARDNFKSVAAQFDGILKSEAWKKVQFFMRTEYSDYVDFRTNEKNIIASLETILPNRDLRDAAIHNRANWQIRTHTLVLKTDRDRLTCTRQLKGQIASECSKLYQFLGNLLFNFSSSFD